MRCFFDNLQCVESSLFEVAVAIHLAYAVCSGSETTFVWLDVCGFDFSREETASQGVVDNNVKAIFAACWDEFGLDGTGYAPVSIRLGE